MKVAVVGATGLVGGVVLDVLKERGFPIQELLLVASAKSVGKTIRFDGREFTLIGLEEAVNASPDIAIFSAGSGPSKEWAPRFAAAGCTVIDNSSAWRMDPDKKLVVPEVNAQVLTPADKIIANPNCSTIQMVVALQPLHQRYKIRRVVVSTYQSVTGTGQKGRQQLENERQSTNGSKAYPHPIDLNCLPHGGDFDDQGYTSEEMKLLHETRKIMGDPEIQVTATVVRVPVYGGHSESVNVEFYNDFELPEVLSLLQDAPGVTLQNDSENNEYPMPLFSEGKDDVFVGRVRRDFSQPNALNLWVVSDNLRKGAATNAVQIAEYLLAEKLVGTTVS